jgi:hypothetical protein
MSTDPTEYPRQIEPTQAAPYNPYEIPSPYGDIPPPPLPRRKKPWLLIGGILLLVVAVSLAATVGILVGRGALGTAHLTATPGVTITPGLTPTPTPTVQPYDATSIFHDFQVQELPVDQVKYGESFAQFAGYNQYSYLDVVPASSSVDFEDPTNRDPAYTYNNVWLGVYNSPGDTQAEEQRINNSKAALESGGPGPIYSAELMVQAGRCLLVGEEATSEYAAIVRNDCT